MRWLKHASRFYAKHPWSTALVVLWIASTICGVRVFTGTPFAFQFSTGQLFVGWYPNFFERVTPVGPELRPGWLGSWGHFYMLIGRLDFEKSPAFWRPIYVRALVPSWLVLVVPRLRAALRNLRALRRVSGIPCTRCRYDMPEAVPVCPECGTAAPTRTPTKRSILLGELKIFGLLVALPLATMTAMAVIGMFV